MDETTLKQEITGYLDAHLTVPVSTSGQEDQWPLPGVILDDWSFSDLVYHNTQRAGVEFTDVDSDGTDEPVEVFRFRYEARLDFICRSADEVEASQLKDAVKNDAFRRLQIDPQRLHNHVKWFRPIDSGDPGYTFREPKEAEEHVAATLESFHEFRRAPADGPWDPIEQIQNSFTIEGNEIHSSSVQ